MSDESISLKRMQITGWLYLLVIAIASVVCFSLSFALSVVVGGVVCLLSFFVAHRDLTGFFVALEPVAGHGEDLSDAEKKQTGVLRKGFVFKFWLRILVIGIVLLLFIKSGKANVFGLILGLSTVVFTVVITAITIAGRHLFRGRR